MHNWEKIVMFRPGASGILMHTMYYANEVRKVEEFRTDTSLVKDKEVELATMLVESLAATFDPEKYKDTYRENLLSMIDAKVQGKELVTAPQPETAKVIDIMQALKRSLEIARKPAAHAEKIEEQPVAADAKPKPAPRNRKATG